MKKHTDYVLDREGNAVAGAQVYVRKQIDSTLATLYSDDGVTTTSNPVTTDNDGEFSFYAADDTYKLQVFVDGVQQQEVNHFQHFDETEFLKADNDLSDLNDAPTALTNLGVSSFAQTVLDDADAAAVRTTIGLGTIATQAASSVTITGGAISGITDLAVADGGTGASSASAARTNLGLGTISTFDETTAAQYQANTSGKALSTDKVWSAADTVALTDAATIAVDMATGINYSVTLGGNRTLGAPSNTTNGKTGVFYFTQDGTGSRTLAYHANYKFAGGSAPVLSTTAGAVDMLFYQIKSSTFIFATLIKDVK
jgi:hypothetical protein